MYITLSILLLLSISIYIFLNHPKLGKLPTGERLERIKKAANYQNGSFQNQSITPDLTEGATYFSVLKQFLFEKKKRVTPTDNIPSVKTDLINLDIKKDVLVWFGHSSYFVQIDGKRMLVDPVLCGHASPISFTTKAFKGTNNYSAEDIPEIDYLFISHDHWDHLDYETIKKLQPKIKQVICALGTGEHLEFWGYNTKQIIEKNWNEQVVLDTEFTVHTVPARHFSGRGLKRNKALWTSFVLQTPTLKIFIGGDSGYDKHFAEAGNTFGEFDLAILENGQYDKSWKYIHLMPDEITKAAKDLKAKKLFAVHNSKFALGNHAWDEPLIKVAANCKAENIPLLTPKIGEQVNLKDQDQVFTEWWKNID
ncbi:MAG: MBL fold metallo-hydrolase [Bacteroidia bacterium]|nr:MBL fold metallo-hydrolase [Bacteroidia bacterium]